jgi:hypothetical protein
MLLDPNTAYNRVDGIIYQGDTPIIRLLGTKFPDYSPLSEQGVIYMNSYFAHNPDLYEVLDDLF